jgi:hypothetical protein
MISTYLFGIPYDPTGMFLASDELTVPLYEFIARAVLLGFDVKGGASSYDCCIQEVSITGLDDQIREFAKSFDPHMTDSDLDLLKIKA